MKGVTPIAGLSASSLTVLSLAFAVVLTGCLPLALDTGLTVTKPFKLTISSVSSIISFFSSSGTTT